MHVTQRDAHHDAGDAFSSHLQGDGVGARMTRGNLNMEGDLFALGQLAESIEQGRVDVRPPGNGWAFAEGEGFVAGAARAAAKGHIHGHRQAGVQAKGRGGCATQRDLFLRGGHRPNIPTVRAVLQLVQAGGQCGNRGAVIHRMAHQCIGGRFEGELGKRDQVANPHQALHLGGGQAGIHQQIFDRHCAFLSTSRQQPLRRLDDDAGQLLAAVNDDWLVRQDARVVAAHAGDA